MISTNFWLSSYILDSKVPCTSFFSALIHCEALRTADRHSLAGAKEVLISCLCFSKIGCSCGHDAQQWYTGNR